eukprot:7144743-Pyramimonas_sp.AAC.1
MTATTTTMSTTTPWTTTHCRRVSSPSLSSCSFLMFGDLLDLFLNSVSRYFLPPSGVPKQCGPTWRGLGLQRLPRSWPRKSRGYAARRQAPQASRKGQEVFQ